MSRFEFCGSQPAADRFFILSANEQAVTNIVITQCAVLIYLLSKIEQAVDLGDNASLLNAAHTLKGSLSNFFAQPAGGAAGRLEQMARDGDLADAADAYVALRREIQDLDDALVKLMSEVT